jgi:hypothetical protein
MLVLGQRKRTEAKTRLSFFSVQMEKLTNRTVRQKKRTKKNKKQRYFPSERF